MSVSGVSSATPAVQAVSQNNGNLIRKGLDHLSRSLQGGDLTGAQRTITMRISQRQNRWQAEIALTRKSTFTFPGIKTV